MTSIELLERPPSSRAEETPWPLWPRMFRSSSSHDEGGDRHYALLTKRFEGRNGRVEKLIGVEVQFGEPDENGRVGFEEIPGSEFERPADLVLLAMGFVHPVHDGLVEGLGLEKDGRGNLLADTKRFETSEAGIFAAGDCRRGQSLVVWAQWEGREAARAVDAWLMGETRLQSRNAAL